jgi:ABC-2 type transport system permease protein
VSTDRSAVCRLRWVARALKDLGAQAWNNPIMRKELRGRMRDWRIPVILVAHLVLAGCMASLAYLTISRPAQAAPDWPDERTARQGPWYGAYMLLLAEVALFSPSLTVGAISGEREQKTLEPLITTLLRTRWLVLGKLIAALAYIALLILATAPIQVIAVLLGGISLPEVVVGLVILIATALVTAALGICISSLTRSTLASGVWTYAAILLLGVGGSISTLIPLVFLGLALGQTMERLHWAVQALVIYGSNALICTNPFVTAITAKALAEGNGSWLVFSTLVTGPDGIPHTLPLLSPWIAYAALCIGIGVTLTWVSIRTIERRRG